MNNPFTLYATAIAHRFHLRMAEWHLAVAMTLCGIVLSLPGKTFALSPYSTLQLLASEQTWSAIMLSVGLIRIMVLAINGALPRGSPHIRAVLAAISASVWAVLLTGYLSSHLPSLMIAVTGAAVVTEFVNIFRAAGSARVEDEVRGGRNGNHPR